MNFPNFGKRYVRAYAKGMARAKQRYPKLYQYFGQLLAEERKAAGLSQSEVARRISKPPSAVWKYENGELRLDMIEFLAVARAIGFEPLDFMRKLMAAESSEH